MDRARVDQIFKFALAVAGRRDTSRERELGAIHLIKLVYLADLAYAERNQGRTFTGAPWRFHHYGPWTEEVWKRIEPVVVEIGAQERVFASAYRDDHRRWSLQEPAQVEELYGQLDRVLPFEVTSAVAQGIRQFGTDTTSLLHEVYRTPPMLGARPGDMLRFELAVRAPPPSDEARSDQPASLSARQEKKRKEALRALRDEVQRKLRAREASRLVPPPTPPSYDEEFHRGVEWLDSLAGERSEGEQGELQFADEIWSASGRGEPE